MKKLFTLLMLMVLSIGGVWAQEITVGRTIELSSDPEDYTILSSADVKVELQDGTQDIGRQKAVYYKSATTTTINATCYRTQINKGALTEFNAEAYTGFKMDIPEGYKIRLSSIDAKVAVSDNLSYRIVVSDKNGDIYVSKDKSIGNYNKANATNVDAAITPTEIIELTGTVYIRLHYWAISSNSKYLVPLELIAKGELEKLPDVVEENITIKSVAINGEDITEDQLTTLTTDKTVVVDNKYLEAPVVSFVKNIYCKYSDETEKVDTDIEEVTATLNGDEFVAQITINDDIYTVKAGLNKGASLISDVESVSLKSETIKKAEQEIKIKGYNLAEDITISLPEVEGLAVNSNLLKITDGDFDGNIVISYQSLEDVAETTVNLTISSGEQKVVIPVTYSSTLGITEIESVNAAVEWDFTKAGTSDILSPASSEIVAFANATGFAEDFNYKALKGQGGYFYRQSNKCFQGRTIVFHITIPGTVEVSFSNTGGNQNRSLKINELSANESGATEAGADAAKGLMDILPGDVTITGYSISDEKEADVRIYSIKFTPAKQTVAISDAKFATCVAGSNLDFAGTDVTAYAVTNVTATTVELTEVEKVAKGQVVVVGAAEAGEYEIPAATEEFTATTSLMKSSDTDVNVDTENYYIVADGEEGVGFYPVKTGTAIPAGKGYLVVESAAKFIGLGLGATGINEVKASAENNGEIYNLNGQRVAAPAKGLYIMNGKKVIFK